MKIRVAQVGLVSFLIFVSSTLFHPDAFSQISPSLQEGIKQYKEENFEEAIEVLIKARDEDPFSSVAAFFLGLAYKQVMDYPKALVQLRDAVTLTPRIKEALVELIDVALQLDKLDEAKKWIKVAEEAEISLPKIAFLKGLVLAKEGKNMEAVEAFEKAKSLDKSIAQAADIQIAFAYLKEKNLEMARNRFRSAITQDPQTDLAGFARRYQDLVEDRIFLERPLRFTLGFLGQYDDNTVSKPEDPFFAAGINDEESFVWNPSVRVNYVPMLPAPWLFNAQYIVGASLHQKHRTTHDSITNSITVSPGYSFGRFALNLNTSYNHTLLRQPSYEEYLGNLSSGPLFRVAVGQNHLLELFGGYHDNAYFQGALANEENRDSHGLDSYVSWIWIFEKEAFFNLVYRYGYDDTKGENWDKRTHNLSLNFVVPVIEKVKLQLSWQFNEDDFLNRHTVFGVVRKDRTYTYSGGVTWDFRKNTSLIAQVTRTMVDSNIPIYEYNRDVYTLGIEQRF